MDNGEFPEWSKGADCKSVGSSFVGPNPSLPSKGTESVSVPFFILNPPSFCRIYTAILSKNKILPENLLIFFFISITIK